MEDKKALFPQICSSRGRASGENGDVGIRVRFIDLESRVSLRWSPCWFHQRLSSRLLSRSHSPSILIFSFFNSTYCLHLLMWMWLWFMAGSTDHRGTPEFPGRTVTLEPAQGEVCVSPFNSNSISTFFSEVVSYLDLKSVFRMGVVKVIIESSTYN